MKEKNHKRRRSGPGRAMVSAVMLFFFLAFFLLFLQQVILLPYLQLILYKLCLLGILYNSLCLQLPFHLL